MTIIIIALAAWAALRWRAGDYEPMFWLTITTGALFFWGRGVIANFQTYEQAPAYAYMFWGIGLVGSIVSLIVSFMVL